MLKNKSGITLLALIITIVIIIILAGITLKLTIGNNGLIRKVKEAEIENEKAEVYEQINLATSLGERKYYSSGTDRITAYKSALLSGVDGINSNSLDDNGSNLITGTVTKKSGKTYDFSVTVPVTEITIAEHEEPINISDYVKIGDCVRYDPLYLDKGKTQNVNANLLTYTSPTGGLTHGNGYSSQENGGGQTFTAKSNLEWRVLSVSNDTIEIIPTTSIKKDIETHNNGFFMLHAGVGYLYAEQELNEICKIYGYGYGADTSIGSSFKVGGPLDEETRTISGTGARSITIEDIEKLCGITAADRITLNSNYGSTTNPTVDVYYPTMSMSTGESVSPGVRNVKYTNYSISYNNYPELNSEIRTILLYNRFWLASRSIYTTSSRISCYALSSGLVGDEFKTFSQELFRGKSDEGSQYARGESDALGVLPVVSIRANCIDITNITQIGGIDTWGLK